MADIDIRGEFAIAEDTYRPNPPITFHFSQRLDSPHNIFDIVPSKRDFRTMCGVRVTAVD
jgi:hypothetical protein